jgi:hypothetical protein
MAFDSSDIASITTALTVVIAVAIAIVQFRREDQRKRDSGTLDYLRLWQTSDWTRDARAMLAIQPDATPESIDARGEEFTAAMVRVLNTYETVALLVHRGLLPADIVFETAPISAVWARLRPWVERRRGQAGPDAFVWFEWLVDRFHEYEVVRHTRPAPDSFREWLPEDARNRAHFKKARAMRGSRNLPQELQERSA